MAEPRRRRDDDEGDSDDKKKEKKEDDERQRSDGYRETLYGDGKGKRRKDQDDE